MCDDNRVRGQLYAIGLGPGDPELLTMKAHRILQNVDTIVVPKARIKSESVARDIVTRAIGEDLPFFEMVFPMSRDKNELKKHWDEAASSILTLINEGKDVAFVTLGDVSLYSTFSYMERSLEDLDPSIKAILVPGISSVQLAAIRFEKPLALGDENYAVYPLPKEIKDLDMALEHSDNLMIMKIGKRLGELRAYLSEKNLLDKASFVRRAGFPDEFLSLDLTKLDDNETGYLSIVMIKKGA